MLGFSLSIHVETGMLVLGLTVSLLINDLVFVADSTEGNKKSGCDCTELDRPSKDILRMLHWLSSVLGHLRGFWRPFSWDLVVTKHHQNLVTIRLSGFNVLKHFQRYSYIYKVYFKDDSLCLACLTIISVEEPLENPSFCIISSNLLPFAIYK